MSKLLFAILLLGPLAAFAANRGLNFQGVITSPSGVAPNVVGTNVNLKVLAPNGCILREENYSGVNITNGYINLVVGKGSVGGSDPGLAFSNVFENSTPRTGLVCVNPDGSINGSLTTYTPASQDARQLRMDVTISGDRVIADFNMRSSPYAINSETLNGKPDTSFINTNSGQGVTQANEESIFNRFTKLDAILNNFNATGTTLTGSISGNAATATNVSGTVAIANGGTGAITAPLARTNLGLGSLSTLSPTGTADATTYLRGDGTWATVAAGGVVSVGSSGAPVTIGGTASNPTVGVSAASTSATGVVQLAAIGAATAGSVVQATDTRLSDSRAPNGSASGDLSGTYPAPTVAKISGTAVTYTSLTSGDFLKYNGTSWVNAALSSASLTNDSNLLKASNMPGNCGASQTLTFSSPTGTWVCSTIAALDAAVITTGTVAAARLPASASYWSAATGGINYAGGNVGIGTATPSASALLEVNSTTKGLLPPRMTSAQRDAISSPAAGLVIFNTTSAKLEVYDGSLWTSGSGSGSQESVQGAGVAVNTSGASYSDTVSMTVSTAGKYLILASGTGTTGWPWSYFSLNCTLMKGASNIDQKGFYYGTINNGSSPSFPMTLYSLQTLAAGDVLKTQCAGSTDASTLTASGWKISILNLGISNLSGADNLGSHTATQNLNLSSFQLVGNGGSNGLSITNAGSVGIGTASPAAKLEVAGEIKLGNTSSTCNGTNEGQQRYNATSHIMEFCNGTSWTSLSGGGSALPAGVVEAFMTATCPTGYLEAKGTAVSRTTYAALFTAIGVTYGAGDGSTTFTLPDLRGYFLRGWDHAAGNDPDAATRTNRGDGTTGDNVGTKQTAQTASHTHGPGSLSGVTNTTGSHQHTSFQAAWQTAQAGSGATGGFVDGSGNVVGGAAGDHSHTVTVNGGASAASGGNETRPKNINALYCIRY